MFSSYLGCVKCVTAPLRISSQAIPKFCKARTVIYTLREAIDRKLVEHMQQGEISPVQHSEWNAHLLCAFQNAMDLCGYAVKMNP